MLGLDPLEVGNEGKYIVGVVKEKAEEALEFLRHTEEAKNAQIIGEATKEFKGVAMQTLVGGKRIIARPVGDPVPRISSFTFNAKTFLRLIIAYLKSDSVTIFIYLLT